ncbi:MAG: ribosome biogenesis GTP-binding protein YihA/YsxC [Flavobacteriales bacterium]|jgi:GTP-binding protein
MNISSAEFISSNTRMDKCPVADKPEYAFIGRSNVGKSSLINMLVNRKGLAKTSSTPGKTQTINHFLINGATHPWYLVDLPGYGYARTARSARQSWERFVRYYLAHRENLLCTFVLVDMRLEPQEADLEFMGWLGEQGIPFQIAFTKSDKLSKRQVEVHFDAYQQRMLQDWEEMPGFVLTSSETRLGRDQILRLIDQVNREWAGMPPLKEPDPAG